MANAVTKLLRNTASNFVFRVINIFLGFLTVPILLNEVGEEGYGLIILMGAITGYFQLFGVGVPTGTVKYVAELDANDDQDGLRAVVDTSLGFFATIGICVAIGLAVFAALGGMEFFVSPDLARDAELLCYITGVIALFSWPGMAYGSTLAGLQRYHTKNVIDTSCVTLAQVGTIIAALVGMSLPVIFLIRQAFTPVRVVITAVVASLAIDHVP